VAVVNPLGRHSVLGLRDIVRLVEDDLARVEDVFQEQARSDVRLVGEIGRYVQEGGGKRVRPALLLLASRLCGYRGDRAVTLASTVEFIHTASLLHDDIIDEATTRRGRPSVNSRWGNDITVLLGDFLYTKSMAMALSQDNLRIMRLLSDVTLRLIEGEILEIERNGDLAVTAEDHLDTIRRKTADLFAACTRIGAILGEAGEVGEEALAGYGLNLGLCFQMVDDLLDFTAEEKTLGKPVAHDLREGKVTLPMIFLIRRAGRAAAEKVKAVLEDRAFSRVTQDELVRMARDCGALDEARELAERYADLARRDLLAFEPSAYRDALEALPGFILSRDH
jgi:octaprenyl-diphosphate synthase